MCFQYLNKFFGANRRRSNADPAGISPRPSLANAPQVSIETVRTVKSGIRGVTVVNVNHKLGHSVHSLGLDKRQSVAAGTAGGTDAVAFTAAANATAGSSAGNAAASGAGDNGGPGKRSSWWGFFGFGRKKSRSSNDSI